MRQVLIDTLRERQTEKHGGGLLRVQLTDLDLPGDDPAPGLSLVLEALERLQQVDDRLADVFSLRAFGGLPFEDIGQLLDVSRYYLIIPDSIGHGQSTKPSDGLRARFPKYGYHDMVEAQHRLLTEGLNVNHLRLVIGTSMGGMHTWLWGEKHPEFMDALMPLGCLPTQISGRNRAWRRVLIDAIRNDPEWKDGNYESQPNGLRTALHLINIMSSNPRSGDKRKRRR